MVGMWLTLLFAAIACMGAGLAWGASATSRWQRYAGWGIGCGLPVAGLGLVLYASIKLWISGLMDSGQFHWVLVVWFAFLAAAIGMVSLSWWRQRAEVTGVSDGVAGQPMQGMDWTRWRGGRGVRLGFTVGALVFFGSHLLLLVQLDGALRRSVRAEQVQAEQALVADGLAPAHMQAGAGEGFTAYRQILDDGWQGDNQGYGIFTDRLALFYKSLVQLHEGLDVKRVVPVGSASPVAVEENRDEGLAEFLERHASRMALMRAAAALPVFCSGVSEFAENNLYKNLPFRMDEFAELLALDACYQARVGGRAQAAADLNAMYAMARQLSQVRSMVGVLAMLAIEKITAPALEQFLAAPGLTAADLDLLALPALPPAVPGQPAAAKVNASALQDQPAGTASGPACCVAQVALLLRFEDVAEPHLITRICDSGEDLIDDYSPLRALLNNGYFRAWSRVTVVPEMLRQLQAMRADLVALSKQPYAAAQNGLHLTPNNSPRPTVLVALSRPRLASLIETAHEVDAMRCVAHAAVAAQRFRLVTGAYPIHLDDLLPGYLGKIPDDRFAGGVVKLLGTTTGIRLYAVGLNLRDERGRNEEDSDSGECDDVVIRLGSDCSVPPELAAEPPADQMGPVREDE